MALPVLRLAASSSSALARRRTPRAPVSFRRTIAAATANATAAAPVPSLTPPLRREPPVLAYPDDVVASDPSRSRLRPSSLASSEQKPSDSSSSATTSQPAGPKTGAPSTRSPFQRAPLPNVLTTYPPAPSSPCASSTALLSPSGGPGGVALGAQASAVTSAGGGTSSTPSSPRPSDPGPRSSSLSPVRTTVMPTALGSTSSKPSFPSASSVGQEKKKKHQKKKKTPASGLVQSGDGTSPGYDASLSPPSIASSISSVETTSQSINSKRSLPTPSRSSLSFSPSPRSPMKDLRKSLVLAERENIRLRDLLAAFVRAHGEMAKAVEAVLDAPGSITSSREVKPVVSSGATMTAAAVETTTAAAKVPSSRAATVPPSWHAKRPATDFATEALTIATTRSEFKEALQLINKVPLDDSTGLRLVSERFWPTVFRKMVDLRHWASPLVDRKPNHNHSSFDQLPQLREVDLVWIRFNLADFLDRKVLPLTSPQPAKSKLAPSVLNTTASSSPSITINSVPSPDASSFSTSNGVPSSASPLDFFHGLEKWLDRADKLLPDDPVLLALLLRGFHAVLARPSGLNLTGGADVDLAATEGLARTTSLIERAAAERWPAEQKRRVVSKDRGRSPQFASLIPGSPIDPSSTESSSLSVPSSISPASRKGPAARWDDTHASLLLRTVDAIRPVLRPQLAAAFDGFKSPAQKSFHRTRLLALRRQLVDGVQGKDLPARLPMIPKLLEAYLARYPADLCTAVGDSAAAAVVTTALETSSPAVEPAPALPAFLVPNEARAALWVLHIRSLYPRPGPTSPPSSSKQITADPADDPFIQTLKHLEQRTRSQPFKGFGDKLGLDTDPRGEEAEAAEIEAEIAAVEGSLRWLVEERGMSQELADKWGVAMQQGQEERKRRLKTTAAAAAHRGALKEAGETCPSAKR